MENPHDTPHNPDSTIEGIEANLASQDPYFSQAFKAFDLSAKAQNLREKINTEPLHETPEDYYAFGQLTYMNRIMGQAVVNIYCSGGQNVSMRQLTRSLGDANLHNLNRFDKPRTYQTVGPLTQIL